MGAETRGQRGRAVSALDLQSEDPGFNTRPNRLLDLFKSSTKVVNNQLVLLYPVGIVSLVTFIGQFQVVPNPRFKTKQSVRSLWYENDFFNSQAMKWSIWSIFFSRLLGLTSLGAVNTAGGLECEQSLFFFRFREGNARARASSETEETRAAAREDKRESLFFRASPVSRLHSRAFCSTDQEKRETARNLPGVYTGIIYYLVSSS